MNKSDSTKQSILEHATQIFYSNGYQMTSTKKLAAEAGISEALIFKYFKSKKGLLNAVITNTASKFREDSFKELSSILDDSLTFKDTLTNFLANRFKFFNANIEVVTIILHQTQYDPELLLLIQNLMTENINPIIKQLIHMGIKDKTISANCNQELLLSMIKSIIFELLFTKSILKQEYDNSLLEEKINLIIKGVNYE